MPLDRAYKAVLARHETGQAQTAKKIVEEYAKM
jgi:hypothetical protein